MKNTIKYDHIAHFRTSQVVNRGETEILFALHGYGQLSEFFLRKLSPLFKEDRLIVVPEATNYSYLEGFSGRVGANWMTRHERASAIINNNQFLNGILESLWIKYKEKPKLKVLGFSQGAATATRWVSQLSVPVERLILWGGGFAHDLEPGMAQEKLNDSLCYLAIGEQDHFLTPESLQKQDQLVKDLGIKAKKVYYPGGHEIDVELLEQLLVHHIS
ncbi:alpha/beta hydrolase [Cecembia rubra]|uniref:Putative esterase n=1 Tax=Cecembia rubra TaxID=1485585 RepID=A0A2P8E8B6_9BACT|nr:alpha/beta hydrolase [Cecembia rubra]PSL05723.1 putative esterase [Cecembia rubra]